MDDNSEQDPPEGRPKFTLKPRERVSNPRTFGVEVEKGAAEPAPGRLGDTGHPGPGYSLGFDFSQHVALFLGGGALLLLLMGFVVSVATAWFSVIAALLISSAVWAGADTLNQKKIRLLHSLVVLWGMALVFLLLVLLVGYPKWHRHSLAYHEVLRDMSGSLTERIDRASAVLDEAPAVLDEITPESEGEDDVKEKLNRQLSKGKDHAVEGAKKLDSGMAKVLSYCNAKTEAFYARRGRIFLQLGLFLTGFCLLPLVRQRKAAESSAPAAARPGMKHLDPPSANEMLPPGMTEEEAEILAAGKAKPVNQSLAAARDLLSGLYLKLVRKIGRWTAARLVKALVIGMIVTFGLKFTGIGASVFLGGCAGFVAFFFRSGYLAGLILALPMVAVCERPVVGVIGVGILIGALILVEALLHRWLVAKYNPTLAFDKAPSKRQARSGGGAMATLYFGFRLFCSVAFFGALVWAGFQFVPRYQAMQDQTDAMRDLERITDRDVVKGIEAHVAHLEESPADAHVLVELIQLYSDEGQFTEALEGGQALLKIEAPVSKNKWLDPVMEAIGEPRPPDPLDGLLILAASEDVQWTVEECKALADTILAEADTHPEGLIKMARFEFLEGRTAESQAWLDKGTSNKASAMRWLRMQTALQAKRGEWKEVKEGSATLLKENPDDIEALRWRGLANSAIILSEKKP